MINFPPHDAEQELSHLRELRDAVLDALKDLRLTADQKVEAIEAPIRRKSTRKRRTCGTGSA